MMMGAAAHAGKGDTNVDVQCNDVCNDVCTPVPQKVCNDVPYQTQVRCCAHCGALACWRILNAQRFSRAFPNCWVYKHTVR